MLSEAQAWRLIARIVHAGDEAFLCNALIGIAGEFEASLQRVTRETAGQMRARVHEHLKLKRDVSWIFGSPAAYTRSDDMTENEERDARVLAALWMALEAEEESRADARGGER